MIVSQLGRPPRFGFGAFNWGSRLGSNMTGSMYIGGAFKSPNPLLGNPSLRVTQPKSKAAEKINAKKIVSRFISILFGSGRIKRFGFTKTGLLLPLRVRCFFFVFSLFFCRRQRK